MLLLPSSHQRDGDAPELPSPAKRSPEALIDEARHRTRRRRSRRLAALLALAGVAAGIYALLTPGAPGVIRGTEDSPFANARAFSGHGELAFVSRDQLWVLDGAGGALRHLRVPAGYEAASPSFSHDGRWLAYVVRPTSENYNGTFQLWIAHGSGAGAHQVSGVRLGELVGWSPHGDLLAVTVGQQLKRAPYGSPTGVDLVSPESGVRMLLDDASVRSRSRTAFDAVGGAAWSPSGSALAVVLQAGGLGSEIETMPVSGSGKPTVWFASGSGPVHIAGMSGRVPAEVIPQLAGWWARWGIAFWVIDFGGVDNRDNTPLAVLQGPDKEPRYLTQTLSLGLSKEVAPGPNGKLAVVASSSDGGREIGAGKTVETCSASSARCGAVKAATTWSGPNTQTPVCRDCGFPRLPAAGRPGSGVSLDPAWSPDGRLLAFVKAPVAETAGDPDHAWFDDHSVYVWNATTRATRRVGKLDGSALPTWSADGRELLYESGDGLWLMPVASGKPVEIVHPLYAETEWNSKVSPAAAVSYYGQIPWQHQFSWWSPSR